MDRTLAPELTRRTRNKSWAIALLVAAGILTVLILFRNALQTSVEAARIRTAVAETGAVENTLDATGEVIPAYEQIIASPVRASIQRILLTPGTQVKPGQRILELDKLMTQLEYDKNKDQLLLKRNSIEQLRMKLDKNLYDAEISDQIKGLNINRLRAELEDTKRLRKVGGRTQEDVTRAENALRIAELEKKQLENDLTYNRKSMRASLRESELQAQIEERNLSEMAHKLKMADVVADRVGVLTWVNENVGSAVNEGDVLVKVADLASFRVEGSCSDVYADQVKNGLPVIVKVNETNLRGTITQVKPAVQNGVIKFAIQLDDNRHASLRPNMKVEVYLVTNRVGKTVRVANGPAFKGKRKQYLYVLQNGVAHRREVEIGLSSFHYVEIKNGVQPGEKVIVSDLSQYENSAKITVE